MAILLTIPEISKLGLKAANLVPVLQGSVQWLRLLQKNKGSIEATPKLFVHLTLVGGGVFKNASDIIYQEMKAAIEAYISKIPMEVTVEVYDSDSPFDLQKVVDEINQNIKT